MRPQRPKAQPKVHHACGPYVYVNTDVRRSAHGDHTIPQGADKLGGTLIVDPPLRAKVVCFA